MVFVPPLRARRKGPISWRKVRRVWATLGITFLVIFTTWSSLAYRPWGVAPDLLKSDATVRVDLGEESMSFWPQRDEPGKAGMLFFPGALVDPKAYVPMAHHLAEAGHPVIMVRVPFRGAFSIASPPEVAGRGRRLIQAYMDRAWIVAGHSKGAGFAAVFAQRYPDQTASLALLGSSLPRRFSLADATFPVLRITANRDGLATPERVRATTMNLPVSTRNVVIEGGNHSQFGHYGFQPMDHFARISRQEQQAVIEEELLRLLWSASRISDTGSGLPNPE